MSAADYVRGGCVCRHGRGKMARPDGYKYDGEWRDDVQHGEGQSGVLGRNGSPGPSVHNALRISVIRVRSSITELRFICRERQVFERGQVQRQLPGWPAARPGAHGEQRWGQVPGAMGARPKARGRPLPVCQRRQVPRWAGTRALPLSQVISMTATPSQTQGRSLLLWQASPVCAA